jgi:hypothetical protein
VKHASLALAIHGTIAACSKRLRHAFRSQLVGTGWKRWCEGITPLAEQPNMNVELSGLGTFVRACRDARAWSRTKSARIRCDFWCGYSAAAKHPLIKQLSGPIKSESPKSLIFYALAKNCESTNQRILSRFRTKTKICESVLSQPGARRCWGWVKARNGARTTLTSSGAV